MGLVTWLETWVVSAYPALWWNSSQSWLPWQPLHLSQTLVLVWDPATCPCPSCSSPHHVSTWVDVVTHGCRKTKSSPPGPHQKVCCLGRRMPCPVTSQVVANTYCATVTHTEDISDRQLPPLRSRAWTYTFSSSLRLLKDAVYRHSGERPCPGMSPPSSQDHPHLHLPSVSG